MQKVKSTIPVYDICSLSRTNPLYQDIIAEPFAAYLKVHPNLCLPHRHSFYHIVFFTLGSGYHTIDFEQFEVKPGHIYFMAPGQVHSWHFDGAVDGYIVNFSGNMFHSFLANNSYLEQFIFFNGIAKESICELDLGYQNQAKSIFEKIICEVSSKNIYAPDVICAALIELFALIARLDLRLDIGMAISKQTNQSQLLTFRKLVDSFYATKHLPKDYAELMYITPNYLNAICKDLLGKPAGEIIRDRLLLEAKRLLVNVSTSIAGVAEQLNFTDNSHFTKFFKKYTKTTPEEFRKGLLGINKQ